MKQLFSKKANRLQRIGAMSIALVLSLVLLNSCRTNEVIQEEDYSHQDSAFAVNLAYNANIRMVERSIIPTINTNSVSIISNTFTEQYAPIPAQYMEDIIDETSEIVENNAIEEVPEYIIHTVTSKDSLWSLAGKYYNNPYLFTVIKEYNHLRSNTIVDGYELKIPNINNVYTEALVSYTVDEFTEQVNHEATVNGMTYIGDYKITGYDPWCVHCCSTDNGITASGVEAEVGRTIAMKGYPYGTKVYIEGYGYYIVEDTGNFKKNTIDIACNSHEECYDITNLQGVAVYLVEGE